MEFKRSVPPGDVQSVHRALDVLEAVALSEEMGATQLATELGLNVSTVHNLLRTLTRRDYLLSRDGRYRLGTAVAMLGLHGNPVNSLPAVVEHEVHDIAQELGHAAYATVLTGHEAYLIARDPGPAEVSVSGGPRRRNPLSMATGRLLVALTRQEEWDEFVEAGGSAVPEWSAGRWKQELQAITERGVCVKEATATDHYLAVGVPVRGKADLVLCALGASVPSFLAGPDVIERMEVALTAAAERMSAGLVQWSCEDR